MAACQYEMLREQKIAENKKRIEQLGLQQVTCQLHPFQCTGYRFVCIPGV